MRELVYLKLDRRCQPFSFTRIINFKNISCTLSDCVVIVYTQIQICKTDQILAIMGEGLIREGEWFNTFWLFKR